MNTLKNIALVLILLASIESTASAQNPGHSYAGDKVITRKANGEKLCWQSSGSGTWISGRWNLYIIDGSPPGGNGTAYFMVWDSVGNNYHVIHSVASTTPNMWNAFGVGLPIIYAGKPAFAALLNTTGFTTDNDIDDDCLAADEDTDDDGDGNPDTMDPHPDDPDDCMTDNDDDGMNDCVDDDDDNDGAPDDCDMAPEDAEDDRLDCDGDGIEDECTTDYDCDCDGILNSVETDDDADGCPDAHDPEPCNPEVKCDCDNDTILDFEDPDDDDDFCPDEHDPEPCNPEVYCDCDDDGTNDYDDYDDDNDECNDVDDPEPCNPEVACTSSWGAGCPGSYRYEELKDKIRDKFAFWAFTNLTQETPVGAIVNLPIPGNGNARVYLNTKPESMTNGNNELIDAMEYWRQIWLIACKGFVCLCFGIGVYKCFANI